MPVMPHMKRFFTFYKFKYPVLLLFVLLLSFSSKAQAFSISTNTSPCFVPGPPNAINLIAVSPPTGAVTYTWAGLGSCNPTIAVSSSTNTTVMAYYPCCGTYTFICTAFNGSSIAIGTASVVMFVTCPPVITVVGGGTACAGSTVALFASGAVSYTWSTGMTGAFIAVSPTTATTYTVMGATSMG